MSATITSRNKKTFKVEIEIPYVKNMLKAEDAIQKSLNEAGILATEEELKLHDTNGDPMRLEDSS